MSMNQKNGKNYNQNNRTGNNSSLYPMQMGINTPGNKNNKQRRVEKRKVNPMGDRRVVDYLDGKALSRYTNDLGKILPKRITGVNALHQREIAKAIKYARHLALIPFVAQDLA